MFGRLILVVVLFTVAILIAANPFTFFWLVVGTASAGFLLFVIGCAGYFVVKGLK